MSHDSSAMQNAAGRNVVAGIAIRPKSAHLASVFFFRSFRPSTE
jgi:hypothetical protein